jgi:hypothetical protein
MGISVAQNGVTVGANDDGSGGTTVTTAQVTQAATAAGGASTGSKVGTVLGDTGTGAGIGGVWGAIGGLVVGVASIIGPNNSASKPGQAGANLKSVPTDAVTALALATKWYTLYFTIYAPGGIMANAATQASGISYWQGQIKADGPAKAWANFSSSPQPVQYGVSALASALTATYGSPYVVAGSPTNLNQSALSAASAPALPLPANAVAAIAAQGGNSLAAQSPVAAAPVTATPAGTSVAPELLIVGAAALTKVL